MTPDQLCDAMWEAYKLVNDDPANEWYVSHDKEPERAPHPESAIGKPMVKLGMRMSDYPKLVAAAKRAEGIT